MGENKNKTKAAMLNELESIKGLLLEEDDIPILQEVIEQQVTPAASPELSLFQNESIQKKPVQDLNIPAKAVVESKTIYEEQQDFFSSLLPDDSSHFDDDEGLLDTLDELEKHTAEVTANKFSSDANKAATRPSLAKATGENPFLPEHIRARLHGNNPPPLFAKETARKIATSSIPSRQLGNTFSVTNTHSAKPISSHQQDIIDSIIDKMMPEIEKELRNRLEIMSKNLLDDLDKE
ncbi:MAG: hypothetical protein EOO53_02970 [Gammaproteobacteria bacterium]|nr:MAG: hypothetical protein EOO53_02970 [Gammaproteobacteria bacterium]